VLDDLVSEECKGRMCQVETSGLNSGREEPIVNVASQADIVVIVIARYDELQRQSCKVDDEREDILPVIERYDVGIIFREARIERLLLYFI